MKKMIVVLLCLALLPALAACGAPAEAPAAPAPTEAPAAAAPEAPAPAEETPAPAEAAEETPAGEETQDPAEIVARILEMQGQPVEDLIDWLGEPESREYSSSCLVEGGQDGQLCYDGFTVYTLVQPDGTETIYDCE